MISLCVCQKNPRVSTRSLATPEFELEFSLTGNQLWTLAGEFCNCPKVYACATSDTPCTLFSFCSQTRSLRALLFPFDFDSETELHNSTKAGPFRAFPSICSANFISSTAISIQWVLYNIPPSRVFLLLLFLVLLVIIAVLLFHSDISRCLRPSFQRTTGFWRN